MKRARFALKHLIIIIALLSVLLTMFSAMYSGYQINKKTLIANTLETNRIYTQKLANETDLYLKTTLQTLKKSAEYITPYMKDENVLFIESERLRTMEVFNSVLVADQNGTILATSPQTIDVKGRVLSSPGGRQALKERKPLISQPYTAITGRLIVFISHPIFDQKGNYLGMIAGTLYLREKNILHHLLGEHFYRDGSYVYVVDDEGKVVYHQNPERINDNVSKNEVVQKLMKGQSGSQRVINTKNQDMLAGYAYIPTARWGIVAQRPTEKAIAPAHKMIWEMVLKSSPLILISIFIIGFISKRIVKPLNHLALYAENSIDKNHENEIENVSAWYYEAIQLKKALKFSVTSLHDQVNHFRHESTTDQLTQLTNRRTMNELLNKWINAKTPFSIILLDIDRFKRVNDTYGHTVGDEVLKYLAKQMQEVCGKNDVCCRFGGEEFIILLPEAEKHEAYGVAEQLRKRMETTVSPCGEIVTISAGVAAYPESATEMLLLIEKADQCLYNAKNSGRNRTVFYEV